MNTGDRRECVITDTSVLINFLAVDRATLLVEHPQIHFFLTDHVRAEVTVYYPEQFARLDAALRDGSLQQLRVESPEELEIFATVALERRLGAGECAATAAAVHRGWGIAIDDKAAMKQIARLYPATPVHTTQSIIVSLIRLGLLDIAEADRLKTAWETAYRFRLSFRSFGDMV